MLNLFNGWLQEVGHAQQGPVSSGLFVGPAPPPKSPPELSDCCYRQLVKLLSQREGDEKELRSLFTSIPVSCRIKLVDHMYDYGPDQGLESCHPYSVPIRFTRSELFHVIDWSWRILYGDDWNTIIIPDLHSILINRKDITIDSPSREEDVARVLSRLGLHHFKNMERDSDCHMTHSDLYTSIFKTVSSNSSAPSRASLVSKLVLKQYLNRNIQSLREMQGVFDMISQMPRLVHIEIGYAANDAILWQIARTCSSLRVLMISGSDVTDKGINWLCGQNLNDKEDDIYSRRDENLDHFYAESKEGNSSFMNDYHLSESLIHLNIAGALHISEKGVRQCWMTFRKLQLFNIQESHLWMVLCDVGELEDPSIFTLPIRSIELTTSSRHNYIDGAARVFPQLRELTIWNFDSKFFSPFQKFNTWETFSCLEILKLNNLCFPDLMIILRQIGNQIKYIDIDNFSIDETPQTCVSLHDLGKECPNLQHLFITMVHCDFQPQHGKLFQNLRTLSMKGAKFTTSSVLLNFLMSTTQLETFTFYQNLVNSLNSEVTQPLDDKVMTKLINNNIFTNLKKFDAKVIEAEQGNLPLGEETLFNMLQQCKELERVGNLAKWSIFDVDRTMATLRLVFNWCRRKDMKARMEP